MWAASTWPTRFPFPLRAGVPDNSWMTPGDSNEISRLRASDADRDRAASVINQALADGRLTAEEHAERLDSIYRAKTHAELAPLLDDLPAAGQRCEPGGCGRARGDRGRVRRRVPQGNLAGAADYHGRDRVRRRGTGPARCDHAGPRGDDPDDLRLRRHGGDGASGDARDRLRLRGVRWPRRVRRHPGVRQPGRPRAPADRCLRVRRHRREAQAAQGPARVGIPDSERIPGGFYTRVMPADPGAALPTFEEIYSAAGDDLESVPWARLAPHPLLLMWLDGSGPAGAPAAGARPPP